MEQAYWFRQDGQTPLFADVLWSRPEHRSQAGKLLIIGGSANGFALPAKAYQDSSSAGIGVTRVILPDALKRTIGKTFEAGEFAPSTPSGSFSQSALEEFLSASNWADAVLLAGDMGRNSETAILLDKFIEKYKGLLTIMDDAVDYFITGSQSLLMRPHTALVLTFPQLQKLTIQGRTRKAFTSDMDLLRCVDGLHTFTTDHPVTIIMKYQHYILVAQAGNVSTTKIANHSTEWNIKIAAYATVWWSQTPESAFKSMSAAVFESLQ